MCRFLEEANCVGMCINLCKLPTQSFIKDSLGMSVNMVPSKYLNIYLFYELYLKYGNCNRLQYDKPIW